MSYSEYLEKVKGNYRQAVKIEWLNPDETVKCEMTNNLYDINVSLNVNYTNGSRRSCTLTLNNDANTYPIDFNNIWVNQKFKLWMGVYLNDNTPYFIPQGVFYVSNPNETYNPSTRTITINGVDKWAHLDGSLSGILNGTHVTNVDSNLFDAIRTLLSMPSIPISIIPINNNNINNCCFVEGDFKWDSTRADTLVPKNNNGDSGDSYITLEVKESSIISFDLDYELLRSNDYVKIYKNNKLILTSKTSIAESHTLTGYKFEQCLKKGDILKISFNKTYSSSVPSNCYIYNIVYSSYIAKDPVAPFLSPSYIGKTVEILNDGTLETKDVLDCPYTVTVEKGKTDADILLEYATILCAHIYYDVNGRLILEPMSDETDDITDTNKEILWDYSVNEKTFLGLTQTYNFDKIHNDIIVLGNIVNGYQFKARVQNRNPLSNTSIQRIGIKTKEPIEDNQYYSDEQCAELAKYYAKVDTILQKSGNVSSIPLYHLDVNKLVTISTPNNNMSKELFLITGFSLSSSSSMTLNVTSVNILKDFSVVEATVYD